jgi:hypothetical protein
VKCERISNFLNFEYIRITLDPLMQHQNGDIKIEIDELEKIIKSKSVNLK